MFPSSGGGPVHYSLIVITQGYSGVGLGFKTKSGGASQNPESYGKYLQILAV